MSGPLVFLAVLACLSIVSAQQNVDFTSGTTRVRFLGKSPNFQIYPNTSQPGYLQIRFAKLQELDSSGTSVKGHVINSLASASPVWETGTVVMDNVTVTYVYLKLFPLNQNNFDVSCNSTGGGSGSNGAGGSTNVPATPGKSGNRRLLYSHSDAEPQAGALPRAMAGARALRQATTLEPEFRIKLFFGNNASVNFPYGNDTNMTLGAGGLKFNVDYINWPFCGANNTLSVDMNLLLLGDAQATANVTDAADGTKRLNITLGNNMTSLVDFANYGFVDGVNGTEKLPVGVKTNQNDGGQTTVSLVLPNPGPSGSFYYDPTVTTSTTTTTSSSSSSTGATGGAGDAAGATGGGGAADAARTTVWALLGALMLSAFLG